MDVCDAGEDGVTRRTWSACDDCACELVDWLAPIEAGREGDPLSVCDNV